MFFLLPFYLSYHLSNLPFRLQLEDTVGMKPSIYHTYDCWTDVQLHTQRPTRYACTMSGHVLIAHPVVDTPKNIPFLDFSASRNNKELHLVDAMEIFNASVPCFNCFLSGTPSTKGIAARIRGTCIWVLTSSCSDFIKCNECSCAINRREFYEIQKDYLKLLLQCYK